MPRLPVQLPVDLNGYLLDYKPKVDPAIIANSFAQVDGIPVTILDDGSRRLLLPYPHLLSAKRPNPGEGTDDSPVVSLGGDTTIPPELADAQTYINAPVAFGGTRTTPIKVNPDFTLPIRIDSTSQMTPIRDQGQQRNTSIAFAVNGALETYPSIAKHLDLSEEYTYHECRARTNTLYDSNGGTSLDNAISIMSDQGTVAENVWPYSQLVPPSNESIPDAANNSQRYKILDSQFIFANGLSGASIKNPNYLEAILAKGHNIVIVTDVAWHGSHRNDVIDVEIDSTTNRPVVARGDTAIVIIGYDAEKKYFIARNSWGTGFGHGGYGYLSYDYLRTYARSGFYIKQISPQNMRSPGTRHPVLR